MRGVEQGDGLCGARVMVLGTVNQERLLPLYDACWASNSSKSLDFEGAVWVARYYLVSGIWYLALI